MCSSTSSCMCYRLMCSSTKWFAVAQSMFWIRWIGCLACISKIIFILSPLWIVGFQSIWFFPIDCLWIKEMVLANSYGFDPMPQFHKNLNIHPNLILRFNYVGSSQFSWVSSKWLFCRFSVLCNPLFCTSKRIKFLWFSYSYVSYICIEPSFDHFFVQLLK